MPDYWVVDTAMGWLEKGVLHEEDLAEIQKKLDSISAGLEEIILDTNI